MLLTKAMRERARRFYETNQFDNTPESFMAMTQEDALNNDPPERDADTVLSDTAFKDLRDRAALAESVSDVLSEGFND